MRLAFHDAGTYDGITGGADGCVDLTAAENNGLQGAVASLQPLFQSAAGQLSRADVWALAAGVAIQMAGGPSLVFKAGRKDSSSCTGQAGNLPNAQLGLAEIQRVFVTRLGFSYSETAALIGAHVLGLASASNSGYNGTWVRQNAVFNNGFFQNLIGRPWHQVQNPSFLNSARSQWVGPPGNLMLNTDVALAFDTSSGCTRFDANAGPAPPPPPGRASNVCQPYAASSAGSSLGAAVTQFANDNAAFFTVFAPAFTKMTALGNAGLACVMSDCSTPMPVQQKPRGQ